MTKAQNKAFDILDQFVAEGKTFSWSAVSDAVKETKFVVKNWMTIRAVLQVFIDEGQIIRTTAIKPFDVATVHVEEYAVLTK